MRDCANGRNLESLLVDFDEVDTKFKRMLRDYDRIKSVFGCDTVLMGGWAAEILCPAIKRQHKDTDVFVRDESHKNRSKLPYQLAYSGYYHAPSVHEGAFCSAEGPEIEIFYSDGSFPFVITSFMNIADFLEDSISIDVKLQKRQNGIGKMFSKAAQLYSEEEGPAHTREMLEEYKIRVASPRSLILMKARAYASRVSQYDSTDIVSLIDTMYSGVGNFLKVESEFIRTANKRFCNYLRYAADGDPLSKALYLDDTKTKEESDFQFVYSAVSSISAEELTDVAGLASCVLGAYYRIPVQDVYDSIRFSSSKNWQISSSQ